MGKLRLGVIYGSRSVEHEVSVITAVQLMKHVDRSKYNLVALYIDKDGRWMTGTALQQLDAYSMYPIPADVMSPTDALQLIDVAIICCHGTLGEDGTVQGLLDLASVPYQGPGVLGSAVSMDKIITKQILQAAGIPVLPYAWFDAQEWDEDSEGVLDRVNSLRYPLFVKPANMGSSVGIEIAIDKKSLKHAVQVALNFDRRVLVDQAANDCIEVNASVLGFENPRVSVLEQPIKTEELLSYADKYERGGGKKGGMASLDRRIPAPISSSLTKKIQEAVKRVFKIMDLSGVVRIDCFANPSTEEFWINEVNTIPGSMSFYLWQETDLPYPKLVEALVETALERKKAQSNHIRSISTNILKKK